jgi:hypothetical protein
MKTNPAPFAPRTATTQSVTNVATGEIGDGKAGRYIFCVTCSYVGGTTDYQDVTVWITFSAGPGADPATPVANTTGFPLCPFNLYEFTLGEGVTFNAISDTTTVNLTWARVGPE